MNSSRALVSIIAHQIKARIKLPPTSPPLHARCPVTAPPCANRTTRSILAPFLYACLPLRMRPSRPLPPSLPTLSRVLKCARRGPGGVLFALPCRHPLCPLDEYVPGPNTPKCLSTPACCAAKETAFLLHHLLPTTCLSRPLPPSRSRVPDGKTFPLRLFPSALPPPPPTASIVGAINVVTVLLPYPGW